MCNSAPHRDQEPSTPCWAICALVKCSCKCYCVKMLFLIRIHFFTNTFPVWNNMYSSTHESEKRGGASSYVRAKTVLHTVLHTALSQKKYWNTFHKCCSTEVKRVSFATLSTLLGKHTFHHIQNPLKFKWRTKMSWICSRAISKRQQPTFITHVLFSQEF